MRILYNIIFGPDRGQPREELEDLVEWYLTDLHQAGQTHAEYFLGWTNKILNAHVHATGLNAFAPRHHSSWGKERLKKIVQAFGRAPRYRLLDDDVPKRNVSWRSAPFLFLFTDAVRDSGSMVHRGDNGKDIPLYTLPLSFEERQVVVYWGRFYRHHDAVWLDTGNLEMPAYKELADPNSELSMSGRSVCKTIEKATGIETYYYLFRYYGRRKGEENRRCPGCGGKWRRDLPEKKGRPYWEFALMCRKCRLVSHDACDDTDERHAAIGEYRKRQR